MRKYLLVLAAVFAIGAIYLLTSRDSTQPADKTANLPPEADQESSIPALIIGQSEAKLTIVAYGDFQCPRCNRFFHTVEQEIRRDFVSKGLAKIEWHNFATIGTESEEAAQAAHCSAEQKFFPAYYDAIFNHMNANYWAKGLNGENVGALSRPKLKQLAASAYDLINQAQFDNCLDSGKFAQTVNDELAAAQSAGHSLNTYVVGKQVIQGVQPYSIFRPVIQSQL